MFNVDNDISIYQAVHYIKGLGLEMNVPNLLFFLSVPEWMNRDYPKAYLLLGWSCRHKVMAGEAISQAMITRLLGRHVSKSQMKNLRKLVNDGSDSQEFLKAAFAIINQFEVLKPLILHEKSLRPAMINRYVDYYSMYGDVCYTDCLLVLFQEYEEFFEELILPTLQEVSLFHRELGKQVDLARLLSSSLNKLEKLHDLHWEWGDEYDAKWQLETFQDSHVFPKNLLIETACITKIEAAGQLRQIATRLNSKAGNLVKKAVTGSLCFFQFFDKSSNEKALLMLQPENGDDAMLSFRVCEYSGMSQMVVSNLAMNHLREWVDIQRYPLKTLLKPWNSWLDGWLIDTCHLVDSARLRRPKSVGELRRIIAELFISSLEDLQIGKSTSKYFFYYLDELDEVAALMIVYANTSNDRVEYLVSDYIGLGNQHVSCKALKHLQEWMSLQSCAIKVSQMIENSLQEMHSRMSMDKPYSSNQLLIKTIHRLSLKSV